MALSVRYTAPEVDRSVPVVLVARVNVRGTGNRAPAGTSGSAFGIERFFVIPIGGEAPPSSRSFRYRALEGDAGKQVTLQATVVVRGTGIQATLGASGIVTAEETFDIVAGSRDARVPTYEFTGNDQVKADGSQYHLNLTEVDPGRYDDITIEWELDRFSAGELDTSMDPPVYTSPEAPFIAGVSYCVIIHLRAKVSGNGRQATAGTTDEAEYRFEFEVAA